MDKIPVPQPKRESYLKHRRDFTRQIILPIILFTVLIAATAVLAGVAAARGSEKISQWADIATIWVVIPLMLMMLVVTALLAALVSGLRELLKVSPRYTGLAQVYVFWVSAKINLWLDQLTSPVVETKTWLSVLVNLFSPTSGKEKKE
jgi:Na+-driven multidrug efflux pump